MPLLLSITLSVCGVARFYLLTKASFLAKTLTENRKLNYNKAGNGAEDFNFFREFREHFVPLLYSRLLSEDRQTRRDWLAQLPYKPEDEQLRTELSHTLNLIKFFTLAFLLLAIPFLAFWFNSRGVHF